MEGEDSGDGIAGDGRSARRERTKGAILGALRALLDEGQLRPTASQIATRAGVSVRSIGQHFGTQEALLQAGSRVFLERLAGDAEAVPEGRPLEARIDALVRQRVAFAEGTTNLRRAIGYLDRPSTAVERAVKKARRDRRGELERAFGAELAALDESGRGERLSALEGAVSGALWDELRGGIGMPRAAAVRVMTTLVTALLTGIDRAPLPLPRRATRLARAGSRQRAPRGQSGREG